MILTFFLEAAPAAGGNSPMSFILMLGLMFVVFYFFLIRPQQKKQKEAQEFSNSMKIGDRIITIGGVHGKIVAINEDNTYTIQVDGPTRLKIEKSAVNADASKALQQNTGTNA